MEIDNPFAEEVEPARRLIAAPVSKHRGARQPKMRQSERRTRIRGQRARISAALDMKAIAEAVDG